MNKTIFTLAVLILSANTAAFADQSDQVIVLKDGSQIKGTLAGINNGVYTVNTPIIGNVQVAASDVASITNANVPVASFPASNINNTLPSGSSPNLDQQIANSQKQLLSNPQSMAILQEMAQDPEIAQALSGRFLIPL
jgi:hypothetical protein